MDDRLGAVFWAQSERHDPARKPFQERVGRVVLAKARTHKAGMQAVGGDAGAVQPACQLAGEQDVLQLRGAVGAERTEALLALQIAEIELSRTVRVRSG